VGITIGFLVLCTKEQLWTSKDILNVMQFAAKVHEILIIASLSAVVLHRVRHSLGKPKGIQLGLLASSFQVNSFLYHTKTEFWGALWFTRPVSLENLSMALLLLSSFILATLAGPTSAIVMVPKLDWYTSLRMSRRGSVAKVFVKATHDQLYPKDINLSLVPAYCSWNNGTKYRVCPSDGLLVILASSFADGIRFLDDATVTEWANITFRGPESQPLTIPASRNVETVMVTDNKDITIHGAFSPPEFMSNVFIQLKEAMGEYEYLNGIKMRVIMGKAPLSNSSSAVPRSIDRVGLMPFATTRCIHSPLGSPEIFFAKSAFDNIDWNTTAAEEGTRVNSPLVLGENLSDYYSNTTFKWLEPELFPQNYPLAGVFVVGSGNERMQGHVFSCVLEGRWIETDFGTQLGTYSVITPQRIGQDGQEDEKVGHMLKNQRPIRIDIDWARFQNNNVDTLFTGRSNMDLLGGVCVAKVLRKGVQVRSEALDLKALEATVSCLEFALSIFVTDGLARIQASVPVEVTEGSALARLKTVFSTTEFQSSDLYTEIPIRVEYFGYGYNMRGPLIKLAFVALLLHSLLALVHVIIILKSGKSSRAWNRIGNLITLALNSKPSSLLTNTGGGIERGRTWALRVRVKADEHDRLGFVVGPDNDAYGKMEGKNGIIPGKKYI
jgi:hypothetical protein